MLILHVDDDYDDREIFCEAVKAVDARISCAQFESGIAALQFLDQSKTLPDYIFMDINMPKMTGLECVQKIRSVPRLLGIKVVMFSTTLKPSDESILSGTDVKWLEKKSRFSDLISSLKDLLTTETSVEVGPPKRWRPCFSDRPQR